MATVHRYPVVHVVVLPALQVPVPEQAPPPMAWLRSGEQVPLEHDLPIEAAAQLNDVASQTPVLPQPAGVISGGQAEAQQMLAPALV